MFRVDFPLSRLFRCSSRVAGIALALSLSMGFSGVSIDEASAASRVLHKSSGQYSVKSRHIRSRSSYRQKAARHSGHKNYRGHRRQYGQNKFRGQRRHYGRIRYRGHNRQYGAIHSYNYPSHLFVGRSLKDVRAAGVALGRRHYRVSTHQYGRRGLVITNQNGVRIISNYGASNYGRYNQGASINGVGIEQNCPANFKCGLRAYNDNSGPRVIRLGKGAQTVEGDPNIEKIGPPKVITYSNSTN